MRWVLLLLLTFPKIKLRLRVVRLLAQGYTAGRWLSWDLNPGIWLFPVLCRVFALLYSLQCPQCLVYGRSPEIFVE